MSRQPSLRMLLLRLEFQTAFTEILGWDHASGQAWIEAGGRALRCRPIAQKARFRVIEVTEPTAPPDQPSLTSAAGRPLRDRVDRAVREQFGVSLLAFLNEDRTECYWRFPRADGKGLSYPERRYYRDHSPVSPILSIFTKLEIPYEAQDEWGDVPHAHVLERLAESGARADKVTGTFFKTFDAKRRQFQGLLSWVEDQKQRAWYVTALLNRVMFIYFLQEKGLLPDRTGYLSNRLTESRLRGHDRFYRDFLLPLCFLGFGTPQGERGSYEGLFEGVPYLDGGLFQEHEVEINLGITRDAVVNGKLPPEVTVPDEEFELWFSFLGSWRWTLDEDLLENDGQINPGILGYIFEKYINQRELGAYYTKEDITGYICRNTIIPRLFDMLGETGPSGRAAVETLPIGPAPDLVNGGLGLSGGEGVDRYLWPAFKTTDFLPTETDLEYAARQERYAAVLQDFDSGLIRTINDAVTYNLNMDLLAADFIGCLQDPSLLWVFYDCCLRRITVLDPAVGSGAFLLAAVNILFPLYRATLARMEEMCRTLDPDFGLSLEWRARRAAPLRTGPTAGVVPGPDASEALDRMRSELGLIRDEHPNPEYYIHKTLIVNNLFGVDIVEEAVEICKLRLFLKLIAHADADPTRPNLGIEPLPDIDFNVLAGNSLVGYARVEDIDGLRQRVKLRQRQITMLFGRDPETLKRLCAEYGLLVQAFRDQQLGGTHRRAITKAHVRMAAELTRTQLNEDLWNLHRDAGLYPDPPSRKQSDFTRSHQPFHWLLEFPQAIGDGGFDVVVGNPPYVQAKEARSRYAVCGFETGGCPDIYANVTERATSILRSGGMLGVIVPLSLTFSRDFAPLRFHIAKIREMAWYSSYDNIPAAVFVGVSQRCTIAILKRSRSEGMGGMGAGMDWTGPLRRWRADFRPSLMAGVTFTPCGSVTVEVPKLCGGHQFALYRKTVLQSSASPLDRASNRRSPGVLGFSQAARNFASVFLEAPPCLDAVREAEVPPSKIGWVGAGPEPFARSLSEIRERFPVARRRIAPSRLAFGSSGLD